MSLLGLEHSYSSLLSSSSRLQHTELAPGRWLKPGGAILPDSATIFVAAASRAALDISFWDDVYGFSYKPVQADMLEHAYTHAGKRSLHVHPCCHQNSYTELAAQG